MSDPFDVPESVYSTSSRRSSLSESESEEEEDSFTSSTSTKLPNIKGKDLFDASIFRDPLRTKVFYTFATTLRQKSRDCVPTASHQFISHLKSRGKLARCYTQNIDRIEEKVGLSTELQDGPGGKSRPRKSTSSPAQLAKMVEEATYTPPSSQPPSSQPPASHPSLLSHLSSDGEIKSTGVECVYLHGSLEQLRCFQCKRTSSWDDMEHETLSGLQPECPHCVQATTAREERGKRALGVGKLRPDIVLYGEEHPSEHLIGPILEHDIKLCRGGDVLLILGTSLKVHGLKNIVRQFANAIHAKYGKVIFVNFTKPPDSIWSDIIDYWVQWDCDAWVSDLQARVPKLWEAPQPPKPKAPPANPMALRDASKVTAAFWTKKIYDDLFRITGTRPQWHAGEQVEVDPVVQAVIGALPTPDETVPVKSEMQAAGTEVTLGVKVETKTQKKSRARSKPYAKSTKLQKPREPAPAILQEPTPQPSSSPSSSQIPSSPMTDNLPSLRDATDQLDSILHAVKGNPRVRKRKKLDGEEVTLPTKISKPSRHTLAPITNQQAPSPPQDDHRPRPMEPLSPPFGPTQTLPCNTGFRGYIYQGYQSMTQSIPQFRPSTSWFASMTGFGGNMIDTTRGPYQPGGGGLQSNSQQITSPNSSGVSTQRRSGRLQPTSQQIALPEIFKVNAQRHNGSGQEAAPVTSETVTRRRSTRTTN